MAKKKKKTEANINHRALLKRMNEVLAEFNLDPTQKVKIKSLKIEAALDDCVSPCEWRMVAVPGVGTRLRCVRPDGRPCGA